MTHRVRNAIHHRLLCIMSKKSLGPDQAQRVISRPFPGATRLPPMAPALLAKQLDQQDPHQAVVSAEYQTRNGCPSPVCHGNIRIGGTPRGAAWRYGSAGNWLREPASACRQSVGVPAVLGLISSWVMHPLDGILLGQANFLASLVSCLKSETPGLNVPGLTFESDAGSIQ